MANTFDVYQYRDGIHTGGIYGTDTDVDWRAVLKDIRAMLEEYNDKETAGLHTTLVGDTVQEKVTMEIAALVAHDATEAVEPDLESNRMYEFALPLKNFEIAFSLTRWAQMRMAPERVVNLLSAVIQAHIEQRLKNVFKPMFGKTEPGNEWGGTWNVSTDCPDHQANTFFGSNHTHIFSRDDATLTLALIRMLEEEIMHHGLGKPGLNGEKGLVLLVNTEQGRELEALADWSTTSGLPDNVVERLSLDGIQANKGIANCYVNINNFIPANYVLMLALDTPYPIVSRRLERQSQYHGLILETPFENSEFPFRDAQYSFSEGCTVTQPSGMAVLMIGGTDSTDDDTTNYTVPTFYA